MFKTKTRSSTVRSPMLPDAIIAKQIIKWTEGPFSTYSPTYVITNEYLRRALKFIPAKTENALVVASSGDHPIFTTLRGAKNVDTFDISYNAKIIMDIKTAAIHTITYEEYEQLLHDIHLGEELTSIKNMPEIISQLPPIEQNYILDMLGTQFWRTLYPDDQVPTFLSHNEFYRIRKIMPKSFNFIWSDIQELSTRLTKIYDFMHLSNIFDYMGQSDSINALKSLLKYTRPGSTVCIACLYPEHHSQEYFNDIFETIAVSNEKCEWNILAETRKDSVLYVMQRGQR